jgi:small subunit ribosomal protein S8
MNDPISDFLTRIRNACSAQQEQVFIPFSKMKAELSRILHEEGYIWGYEVDTNNTHPRLKLKLKYQDKAPVIRKIDRVSKPGLRKYVSTPRGIMTGAKARKANVGGELLATIW